VYRFSLAIFFVCSFLPGISLGEGVDFDLVNFYQDFSGQQGANGISSVVVPSASNASPSALVFDAEVSLRIIKRVSCNASK